MPLERRNAASTLISDVNARGPSLQLTLAIVLGIIVASAIAILLHVE
jgi:hypothetical protein